MTTPIITVLDNHLRVASEALPEAQTVAFALSIGCGARDEDASEHGIAHLLEHMAFKGTNRMNARQLADAFDLMGGNINAYTSNETTVYYVKVLKEYADAALQLLCDIVRHSTIDEEELERERGVILQELAMHLDTPDDLVFDQFQECAYGTQALGRSILGTSDSIRRHSRDAIRAYIAKHYAPSRMVLSAAGAVDHAAIVAIAQEAFGDLVDRSAPARSSAAYRGDIRITHKKLEQVQFVAGYEACALTDPDYYALQVFTTLLGGGMSSRLFQEIREKRGLVYSVSSFASCYADTGTLSIYAATGANQIPELMPALAEVLHGAAEHIHDEELLRAKNQMKAGVVMTRESSGAIAEWIGRHLLIHGRVKSAPEILAAIDAVSIPDLQRVAARFLGASPLSLTTLGPLKTLDTSVLPQK
jgi:predicted Zn-dependent peptidase